MYNLLGYFSGHFNSGTTYRAAPDCARQRALGHIKEFSGLGSLAARGANNPADQRATERERGTCAFQRNLASGTCCCGSWANFYRLARLLLGSGLRFQVLAELLRE